MLKVIKVVKRNGLFFAMWLLGMAGVAVFDGFTFGNAPLVVSAYFMGGGVAMIAFNAFKEVSKSVVPPNPAPQAGEIT